MKDLYTQIKALIDETLKNEIITEIITKDDLSLVTSIDLRLNEKIVQYYLSLNPHNPIIIAEESFGFNQEDFNLKGRDFLVLDPIDGTENFGFLNNLFGIALSGRVGDFNFDFLYTPFDNKVITSSSSIGKLDNKNNINLYSTGSLPTLNYNNINTSSIRVLGSSSVMFSMLLQGKARSYTYHSHCKIWDCFTGLRIANRSNKFEITGINQDWFDYPQFKTSWKVQRK